MSILNPIKHLLESRQYPLANAQRTTFWQKVKNTFLVFSGNYHPAKCRTSEQYKNMHLGVYDYLTLGIPLILTELLDSCITWSESDLLKRFFFCIDRVINLPCFFFATALTLVCLPFVAVTHVFAGSAGGATKAEILAYQVETDDCKIVVANPFQSKEANNVFLFAHQENRLFYKDATGNLNSSVSLKDAHGLRTALGLSSPNHPYVQSDSLSTFMSRENLKKFISDETRVLDSYYTLGQLLEAKGCGLEDLAESDVEIEETDVRLTFKDEGKKLTSLTLSLKKVQDCTLFANLRRLNVARLASLIEEDSSLTAHNLPG